MGQVLVQTYRRDTQVFTPRVGCFFFLQASKPTRGDIVSYHRGIFFFFPSDNNTPGGFTRGEPVIVYFCITPGGQQPARIRHNNTYVDTGVPHWYRAFLQLQHSRLPMPKYSIFNTSDCCITPFFFCARRPCCVLYTHTYDVCACLVLCILL